MPAEDETEVRSYGWIGGWRGSCIDKKITMATIALQLAALSSKHVRAA